MSNTKITLSNQHRKLSYTEFMARHKSERSAVDFLFQGYGRQSTIGEVMRKAIQPQVRAVMDELTVHPFFRLLRSAARENCPEAFCLHLSLWLCRFGIIPPEGVFVERRGAPGRPRDQKTALIYEKWIEIGKPPLGRQKLAYAVYGAALTRASSKERKRIVDRCRRAVARVERRLSQLCDQIILD